MPHRYSQLPEQVPDGTKYVMEVAAIPGHVHHFVEFPDGRRIDLGIRRMVACPKAPMPRAILRKPRDQLRSSGKARPPRVGRQRHKRAAQA